MTTRLTPYGSEQHAHNLAKVGKEKTPRSLAARMPSPDIAAKVGTPAPTLGIDAFARRVVRRNAQN